MRAVARVASLALSVACGAQGAPQHAPRTNAGDASRDASASASAIVDAAIEAGLDRMELLVARHDRVAPGTREIARKQIDLDASKRWDSLALDAFAADTCVRALFDADAPTAITLVDEKNMTLAQADAAQGAIGAAGPVCFRKGDVVTFRFNGESRLRIVVWASP